MVRVPSFSVVQALTSNSSGRSFCSTIERVVARGSHGHGQALKYGFIVVHDRAGFAVHEMSGPDDVSAERFADRLVAEAYSKHRNFTRKVADQIDADACLMRRAGAGRDNDLFRMHGLDLAHRDLVVAANLDVAAQFADVLDEVVGERIVVVEDENQEELLVLAYTGGRCQIVDFRFSDFGRFGSEIYNPQSSI